MDTLYTSIPDTVYTISVGGLSTSEIIILSIQFILIVASITVSIFLYRKSRRDKKIDNYLRDLLHFENKLDRIISYDLIHFDKTAQYIQEGDINEENKDSTLSAFQKRVKEIFEYLNDFEKSIKISRFELESVVKKNELLYTKKFNTQISYMMSRYELFDLLLSQQDIGSLKVELERYLETIHKFISFGNLFYFIRCELTNNKKTL